MTPRRRIVLRHSAHTWIDDDDDGSVMMIIAGDGPWGGGDDRVCEWRVEDEEARERRVELVVNITTTTKCQTLLLHRLDDIEEEEGVWVAVSRWWPTPPGQAWPTSDDR